MRDKEKQKEYMRRYYQRNAPKKRAANKVWMAENREYRRQYSWELLLKNKYHITKEDYNNLFEVQKGCCAICKLHQENFEKRLYVDHNHETGKVRALLCVNCNMLIGHAQEDIEVLGKAIKYLNEHGLHI